MTTQQPAWSKVLAEINSRRTPQGTPDFDSVRREKLRAIFEYTQRPLLIHVTACTVPAKILPPQVVLLDFADVKAFETVTDQLPPGPLDIVLHTPGGFAEAVESIARVIRPKFNPVRFVIPHIAKSAGTMLAMCGDEILMHPNGELGPTDPQMILGGIVASADAILAQFEQARDELLGNERKGIKGDPQKITLWGPILSTMGPALIVQCQNAKRFTLHVLQEFLAQYMFRQDPLAEAKAQGIAEALNSHERWLAHGRRIGIDDLISLGVSCKSLTTDPRLFNLVNEAWAAIDLTLSNTPAARITENHLEQAVIRMVSGQPLPVVAIQQPTPQKGPPFSKPKSSKGRRH